MDGTASLKAIGKQKAKKGQTLEQRHVKPEPSHMESLEVRCQNFGLPDMAPFGEALVVSLSVSLSRPDRDAGNAERGLLFCYAMMHGFDPCCSDLFPFSDQCVGNLHKTCLKKLHAPKVGSTMIKPQGSTMIHRSFAPE